MFKLLKVMFLSFSVVLVLVMGVAFLLPIILDPNDFKPEIEAAAFRVTGNQLVLDGPLELSVFPWLGVSTGKFLIYNQISSERQLLAKVDESHIKVKLLPLLVKKIELNRVVFKNPLLRLEVDEEGKNNWHNIRSENNSLSGTSKHLITGKETLQISSYLQGLVIAGVSLENGKIILIDKQQDRRVEMEQVNVNIGTLAIDQPAEIKLSMRLQLQGQALDQLTAKTRLVFNKTFDQFKLTEFEVEAKMKKAQKNDFIIAKMRSSDISLDWQKQQLEASEIRLTSGGVSIVADLTASKITDQPELRGSVSVAKFNPREFAQILGKPLPILQSQSSFTRLSGSFAVVINKHSAQLNHIEALFDESIIKGHCTVSNFQKPLYEFDINIDTMDLDQYALNKKTSELKMTRKNLQNQVNSAIYPIALLRKINATGQLSLSSVIISGLTLQDFAIKLETNSGDGKPRETTDKLSQGNYSRNLMAEQTQQHAI